MPLTIVRNDITKMRADAIVNPADPHKLSGGGCCGAILRAAGSELAAACRETGPCPVGEARITPGYRLNAKFVIHTAGPVWNGGNGDENRLLRNCYTNSLHLAAENGCTSIAFPLISSGAYGFPPEAALKAAREAITEYLYNEDENDMDVQLVLFTRSVLDKGNELFRRIAEYIDDNYEGIARFNAELPNRSMYNRPRPFSAEKLSVPDYDRDSCISEESSGILADACLTLFDEDMFEDLDEGFSEMLIRLIDERGFKDSDVYKRANKDRKLFNKIKLNANYHPGKQTALAFAVALKLNLEETKQLLERAGFALTHASKGDVIVEYFIKNGDFDIMRINEALFAHDEQLL